MPLLFGGGGAFGAEGRFFSFAFWIWLIKSPPPPEGAASSRGGWQTAAEAAERAERLRVVLLSLSPEGRAKRAALVRWGEAGAGYAAMRRALWGWCAAATAR